MRMVGRQPHLRASSSLGDLRPFLSRGAGGTTEYGPLVQEDQCALLRRHWRLLSGDVRRDDPTVDLLIEPTSIGMFRLMSNLEANLQVCE